MHDFLVVFVTGYLSVFLLGFQSRLVNHGNFAWAAMCSFTIAFFQAHLWSSIVHSQGNLFLTLAYGISGAAAITSAMWVHRKFFINKNKESTNGKGNEVVRPQAA